MSVVVPGPDPQVLLDLLVSTREVERDPIANSTRRVEKLRTCMDSYDCRDADVEADLIRISRGYVGEGGSRFRSETAYQETVTRARTGTTPAPSVVTETAPAGPPSRPPTGTPGF